MRKQAKFISSRFISEQAGEALILILIFLLLGSLTILPTLAHMSTALKTGVTYENKSNELFTADAGIENGLWRIKYDSLGPDYDIYDFSSNWTYQTDPVNNRAAGVTIQNVWIPTNASLFGLGITPAQAKTMVDSDKLVVTGTSGAVPGQPYNIKVDFTPASGDNLTIKSIGIWLPQGFTYNTHSSTLEADISKPYYSMANVSPVPGGQAVVWSYHAPYPLFTSFPNYVSDNTTLTFNFTFTYSPTDKLPVAIAWVTTEMHDSSGNPKPNLNSPVNVPIAWDTDTRIYQITSATGNTQIETYSSKSQLRKLGDAAAGDYVAVGNSLMIDSSHSPPPDHGIRDQLLPSSDATVSTLPTDGDVLAAYLYWSGWRNDATTVFSDSCGSSSSFTTNWVNGGDWAYYSGNYRGQHTGADSRRYLTMNTGQNLSTYPSGTMITLDWSQSIATLTDIFSDTCGDLTNWNVGIPTAWGVHSNQFRAQYSSGGDSARTLTMTTGQNLSGYSSVSISWSQSKSGTLDSGDFLYYNLSSDNGTSWSSNITAGSSTNFPTTFSATIASQYLTSGFKIRFYIAGFGSGKYCYLDNIKITPAYSATDGLDFALSADGGTTWSSNIQAFRGPNSPTSSFSYNIPGANQYLINGFKLRFYLVGMGGSQQYCYLDNIKIIVSPPDNSVVFKINDVQYSLSDNGTPQTGGEVTASVSSVLPNTTGYSYACRRDVTNLVKKYPVVPGEQHHTGNAKYTVGGVQATTGNEISYAGWSIIIVYSSPETAGHYLYLRDVFAYNGGNVDADFDGDGQPGGDISGFKIPDPIKDKNGNIIETNAASLTCFVGEGDWCYSGDFIALNAPSSYLTHPKDIPNSYKLWDGITLAPPGTGGGDPNLPNTAAEPDNVWNSKSIGMSQDGVDIDTFQIPWTSQLLKPGDSKMHLDMYSQIDQWNLIYFVLSVRSETVTSGAQDYTIKINQ